MVLTKLVDNLVEKSFICSMWEGGAVANGRADEYSDLDVVLIVEDEKIDDAFLAVEEILSSIAQINHKWKVPEPTWHGHSQTYYKLTGFLDCFFIDIVVMKESSRNRFMEYERHGNLSVKFDHKGYVNQSHVHAEDWQKKISDRIENLSLSFPIYKAIVEKEILRGKPVDAFAFYNKGLVSSLAEVWGMKFRPFRYDFGLRYTSYDFPEEEYGLLQKYCYPGNLKQIQRYIPEIESRFYRAIEELKSADKNV